MRECLTHVREAMTEESKGHPDMWRGDVYKRQYSACPDDALFFGRQLSEHGF